MTPQGEMYEPAHANLYATLGIEGTTYELGFAAAAEMFGSLEGKTALDFGSGSGRSARFLKSLGAVSVIGVDCNHSMIAAALAQPTEGIRYCHATSRIPLGDRTVNAAFSASVFVEIKTRLEMARVCTEIARVMRPRGTFVLMSTNPEAFSHNYRSFSYGHSGPLVPGRSYTCKINCDAGSFETQDTLWREQDYRHALHEAGFEVDRVIYPTATKPEGWTTAEARIAPFLLVKASRRS